jgi:hypothetical protein
MKIRLVILMLSFSMVALNAQTTEHLKFKGVPIDGTLEAYTKQMNLNGFTLESSQNGTALFIGDFAGFKDCKVGVSTLNQKNLVYKIGVKFLDKSTWGGLNGDYQSLKSMLTEKYGKPTDEQEKFDSEYGPVDDNNRIHQVKFDKCKYISFWQTTNGIIQLSIDHISVTSCFVKLGYFDKINGDIIKAKAIDDL